jgi:cbb3-type cytochrome oxidase subunit 3
MKLSDVVGHSGLAGYAEIALLLFFAAFIAILVVVFRSSRRDMERAARLPLDDEPPKPSAEGEES